MTRTATRARARALPTRALPLSLFLGSAGCFGVGSEFHDDVLPTEEKLKINLPMYDSTAKDADSGTEFAQYYSTTRSVTEGVNGIITAILGTVGYVTTLQPSWTDDTKTQAMWGPYSDSGLDPVETGLWVRMEEDESYTWALFYLPNGGAVETDAVPIVAGIVDAGSTRDDASGQFGIDFTTAVSMDPAVALTGEWGVQYAYDADGVGAVVAANDYGFAAGGERVDAAYSYNEDYEGSGEMDLAWLADIDARGANELATMRSRWQADGQGRGDVQVTGGDLGSAVVSVSECWGSSFTRTFYTDSAGIEASEGSEDACAYTPAEYATEGSFAIAE
ncbi:MAG: hypothetical protein EXR69_00860 [Myxococcales bacterium]|nr:hypothetical protein [Myxococcales bacterium]